MSWVCPICSTNNEDSESKCMVCDYDNGANRVCTLTQKRVRELGLTGNIVIPEKYNIIGEGAFRNRPDVISVTLHKAIRKISKESFYGCTNLQAVIVQGELKSIGKQAFYNCTALTHKPTARYIADDAFFVAPTADKKVVLPKSTEVEDRVKRTLVALSEKPTAPKRAAQFILLCLAAVFVFPLMIWFSSLSIKENNSIFVPIVGAEIILFMFYLLMNMRKQEEKKEYRPNLLLMAGILFLAWFICVFFHNGFRLINAIIIGLTLVYEVIALIRTKRTYCGSVLHVVISMIISMSILCLNLFI